VSFISVLTETVLRLVVQDEITAQEVSPEMVRQSSFETYSYPNPWGDFTSQRRS
jgi:hypothetical protein